MKTAMSKPATKMHSATVTYNRMTAKGSRRCNIINAIAKKCELTPGAAARYYQLVKHGGKPASAKLSARRK